MALKLSRDARGTTFEDATCRFRDLEILCEAWKSELQCLLGKVINQLSSINLKETVKAPTGAVDFQAVAGDAILSDFQTVGSSQLLGARNFDFRNPRGSFTAIRSQPRVLDHVIGQVVNEKETVGYALNKAMIEEKDICKYDVKGTEFLQAELVNIPGFEAVSYTHLTLPTTPYV